jgi:hypothetical protein
MSFKNSRTLATTGKRAVEMPVQWKEWKAKSRLPTLSTSPLEISPKTGEIPTFPPAPAARADGIVENQRQVSHYPTAPDTYLSKAKGNGGRAIALRPRRRSAPPKE